jgi:hypothetical protein
MLRAAIEARRYELSESHDRHPLRSASVQETAGVADSEISRRDCNLKRKEASTGKHAAGNAT